MRNVDKVAKALGAVALSAALALGCAGTALAAGGSWQKSPSGWWYAYDGGGYASSGWESVGGTWYLFDDSGWMETGWQSVGGTWYYLKGSGAMAEGWAHDGSAWYYLEPGSGAMATGWKSVGDTWYLLSGSGAMLDGWQKVGGLWYYMEPSGAMACDRWVGNYYVGASGAMLTDAWVGSYYVGPDGLWAGEGEPASEPAAREAEVAQHTHSWQPVFEDVWVVDSPRVETPVYERLYVCKTCGWSTQGSTGLACIDSHLVSQGHVRKAGRPTMNYEVRSALVRIDVVEEVGHYERVQTGERCGCGEVR